jgi:hypothetical protein
MKLNITKYLVEAQFESQAFFELLLTGQRWAVNVDQQEEAVICGESPAFQVQVSQGGGAQAQVLLQHCSVNCSQTTAAVAAAVAAAAGQSGLASNHLMTCWRCKTHQNSSQRTW